MSRFRTLVSRSKFLVCSFALFTLLLHLQHQPAVAQIFGTDHTPLIDGDDGHANNPSCPQGNNLYKCQFKGFLYGHWNDGTNNPDPTHDSDGRAKAHIVVPLCFDGTQTCQPPAQKKIVVLLIGMSHWTKEGCANQLLPPFPPGHNYQTQLSPPDAVHCSPNGWSFINKAIQNTGVNNANIAFVDCAELGAVAGYWVNDTAGPPNGPSHLYSNCNTILANWPSSFGGPLSPAQVQVVLFKEADSGENTNPPPPNPPLLPLPAGVGTFGFCSTPAMTGQPDACNLYAVMIPIAQQIKIQYPHVQQMFLHSRSYAGFADPSGNDGKAETLNPEPYAYEQGFAVKWLIQAQVDEVKFPFARPPILDYRANVAPWLDWGAYFWASGQAISCQGCPGVLPNGPPKLNSLVWRDDRPTHMYNNYDRCPVQQTQNVECDYQALGGSLPDNTHPSLCGRDKASNQLMYFYCNSPYTVPWFAANGLSCAVPQLDGQSCSYGQGDDAQ
jgi:hypothetical protein